MYLLLCLLCIMRIGEGISGRSYLCVCPSAYYISETTEIWHYGLYKNLSTFNSGSYRKRYKPYFSRSLSQFPQKRFIVQKCIHSIIHIKICTLYLKPFPMSWIFNEFLALCSMTCSVALQQWVCICKKWTSSPMRWAQSRRKHLENLVNYEVTRLFLYTAQRSCIM